MGNPHLIFFLQDITKISLSLLGPVFEKHELFPEKTNVHFSQIINRDKINVLVWERGAGATLACWNRSLCCTCGSIQTRFM